MHTAYFVWSCLRSELPELKGLSTFHCDFVWIYLCNCNDFRQTHLLIYVNLCKKFNQSFYLYFLNLLLLPTAVIVNWFFLSIWMYMETANELTFWTFITTRTILSVLKLNYNKGIISLISITYYYYFANNSNYC